MTLIAGDSSNWRTEPLGSLVKVAYGKGLAKALRDEQGPVEVYGSSGVVGRHGKALVEGPVIIVGRKGNAGSVYLSEGPAWPIDTAYYFVVPSDVSPKFLAYQLGSLNLGTLDSSTAIPSLRRPDLEAAAVVVPPLDEQRRVVDVIETHLSHLDAGIQSLQRVERQVGLVWASALATSMKCSSYKPLEAFAAESGITDGPFGSKLKTSHYTSSGPRVLRLQNIGRGEFLDDHAYISEDHFNTLRKHEAKPGDLLVASLYGDQLRSCVVPDGIGDAIVKADCIRIRPAERADAAFLSFALQRPAIDAWCASHVKGVGRQRLGLSAIRALPIPDLSIEERKITSSQLASIRVSLDHMLGGLGVALKRATTLRQALLSSAFQGKL